jgi:predicted transcriptional regulator
MVIENKIPTIARSLSIRNVKEWFRGEGITYTHNMIIVVDDITKEMIGVISKDQLFKNETDDANSIESMIMNKPYSLYGDNSLQLAVEFILKTGQDILPIEDRTSHKLIGMVSSKDILQVFEQRLKEENHIEKHIFLRSQTKQAFRNGVDLFRKKN